MPASFAKNLRVVTGVHVAVISALFISGWVRGCQGKKKDVVIPLEFLVEVPSAQAAQPIENDIPEPIKKSPVKEPVKKPPVKKPIKISDKVISNPLNKKPPKKPLSAEEIEKLLKKGAKPSDRTVIPEDDQIYAAMLKQAFYDAWTAPSEAEVGDAVTVVEVRLAPGGRIVSARIKKGSGIGALDQSVSRALKYVRRVNGLSADFISRHEVNTLRFRVDDGAGGM